MRWLFRSYCKAWLFSFSAIIRHHGRKPSPNEPHLFVANHTSFVDYFLMSSHKVPHATVAQNHGGLFGLFQRYALTSNGSLFFNRNEARDRVTVARRMQDHINKLPQVAPLIIFPEGTCVNNESTVLFHKGAFELDSVICPIAIKYNKRLLDPYWNTREQTFTQHVIYLMTRWFMIADVWWLPPQRRHPGESGIEFANRVKALISDTAGLRNLSWDGYMKNCMRNQDREKMRKSSQEKYVSSLRRRMTPVDSIAEWTIPKQPSEISKRRHSTSMFGASVPNDSTSFNSMSVDPMFNPALNSPYIPSWLSDAAVVDIKNELLLADARPIHDPALALVRHIKDHKDDVVQTWRFYSRSARRQHSPPMPLPNEYSNHVAERRLENSSWRYWFKQRMDEGRMSPISLPDVEGPFMLDHDSLMSSSDPHLPHCGSR